MPKNQQRSLVMDRTKIEEEDILVRVYVSEKEKKNGRPLYEAIVEKARELNLAGATVSKGIMGFGADRRIHTAKLVELSENLPIIVEMIDTVGNIDKLLPILDEMVTEGFMTIEKVHVRKYRLKK
jgi:uncharacterized protein